MGMTSTRQFITKSSDLYFELEKCAVMYEYINSGKCIKLEGQEGAFGLMKSDVKRKKYVKNHILN